MRRLVIAILVAVLLAGGMVGCEAYWSDEGEGWTGQDEGQSLGGSDVTRCDPEIAARSELY